MTLGFMIALFISGGVVTSVDAAEVSADLEAEAQLEARTPRMDKKVEILERAQEARDALRERAAAATEERIGERQERKLQLEETLESRADASRDKEPGDRIEIRNEMAADREANRKNLADERREMRRDTNDRIQNARLSQALAYAMRIEIRFSKAVQQMDTFLIRMEDRLTKLAASGKDVTEAKEYALLARTSLNGAEDLLLDVRSQIQTTIETNDDSASSRMQSVRLGYANIHRDIIDARRHASEAMISVRAAISAETL